MPSLTSIHDNIETQVGAFKRGVWDYIGLAQRYPQLEVLGQLAPRREPQTNYENTILYQTETESSGGGKKPGEPVQPQNRKKALKRKVKMVKWVDSIGWTLDQNTLQGKPIEHIVRQIQMDLVDFDLHWWQDFEEMMLNLAPNIIPEDDETLFGLPAWVTANSGVSDFSLYGGLDPYAAGRPGGIAIADQPKYTNPVAKFQTIQDDDFFKQIEKFLIQRKLMGAVPNPRLLPDTPNDICYVQLPTHVEIQQYMQAGNENTGTDAGRYRGNPSYKGIPFVNWHVLGHPDSPVRATTPVAYVIDWNSFTYGVQPEFDRKIEGPTPMPYVPSGRYITSEIWHQLSCDRPDRNLYLFSDNADLNP